MSGDKITYKDEEALNEAFKTGRVFDASREECERFLRVLGHINVNGPESFRSRAVIRSLILNHLQMTKVIRDLDTANKKTQTLVVILAVVAVGVGLLQALIGVIGLCLSS